MSIGEKFENFKGFVIEVSRNEKTVAAYRDMTWLKLQSADSATAAQVGHRGGGYAGTS
jgi:hypothetical protein